MDETTSPIVGCHTHGVYGRGYGYEGYGRDGRNDDGVLVDIINKNDLNSSIREVGRAVDIQGTASAAGFANVAKGQSDGIVATSGLITDLGRDINAGVHNTLVQNLHSFNGLERQVTNNANMIIGQGRDILAEIARNSCEVKTEMLKQHCDIKELVRDENTKTRELITANRILELERKLNDVKSDNSNLRQSEYLLSQLQTCCPKTCPSTGKGNGRD